MLIDKFFLIVVFICLLFSFQSYSVSTSKKTTLNISILFAYKGQRDLNNEISERFKILYPDIELNFIWRADAQYKKAFPLWLQDNNVDVLYWQAGERFKQYVNKDLVLPISELWENKQWDNIFASHFKDSVSHQGDVYALPLGYYSWGIFYNAHLFNKIGIKPFRSWPDLIDYCQIARSHGLIPIMVATKEPWPIAAWFDYLSLRLHGFSFHQALLAGNISYQDKRVVNVFVHWKELIDNKCFNTGHEALLWHDILPYLLRDKAGASLLGNFIENEVPQRLVNKLGFSRFPIIEPSLPQYENIPLQVMLIAKNSKKQAAAKKLLTYFAHLEIQELLANYFSQSAPHRLSENQHGNFIYHNEKILAMADGITQYFDRDIKPSMEAEALNVLVNFINNPNVVKATNALETIRLKN